MNETSFKDVEVENDGKGLVYMGREVFFIPVTVVCVSNRCKLNQLN